jgi:hypothetical protein
MGYTTDFEGGLQLTGSLTTQQFDYIKKLNDTRRMKRNVDVLMELHKGKDGYPGRTIDTHTPLEIYGEEGEYFVGGGGYAGQDNDNSVIDFNTPPNQLGYGDDSWENCYTENNKRIKLGLCQPGLWLGWTLEKDGDNVMLVWDGGEKFYHYVEWLQYLITHFFEKWDVKLNGEITWVGEDRDEDRGKIVVKDNVVKVLYAITTYVEE